MAKIKWVPFSKKAMLAIKYSDAFINIFEGAVRSSKTVASIVRWIEFVEDSPHNEFLISGKTESTIYRNIIGGNLGILNIMGESKAKFIKSGDGGSRLEMKFRNKDKGAKGKNKWVTKVCYVVGANDDKSENKIRGMTIGGWYSDEITLHPQSFVTQAINRMSLDGAMAFWTTNPDSPYHFIKTDYIDPAPEKGYRVFHFELTDNLALSDRYKENLKMAYKGLWYKRMVLGLWVMADGVIYDMFVHEQEPAGGHIVAKAPEIQRFHVGVDYGNANATSFLLLGEGDDGRCYVMSEYYHSGKEDESKAMSPSQYAREFIQWLTRCGNDLGRIIMPENIFIDPSAKGFILELYNMMSKQMRRKIRTANNNVLFGIETVSSLIGNDGLRVVAKCTNVLKELSTYCWDATAQKRGEDKPIKDNDHTMDALRYAIVGTRKIWQKYKRLQEHQAVA